MLYAGFSVKRSVSHSVIPSVTKFLISRDNLSFSSQTLSSIRRLLLKSMESCELQVGMCRRC